MVPHTFYNKSHSNKIICATFDNPLTFQIKTKQTHVNSTEMETTQSTGVGESPVCVVVLGMAGSGKTTFVKKLASLSYKEKRPYLVNLDPACREVPYPVNIGESAS